MNVFWVGITIGIMLGGVIGAVAIVFFDWLDRRYE